MAAVDAEQNLELDEDMGYNVPFTAYIWKCWQEMLDHVYLRFMRFQQAIERRQPQSSLAIASEIQRFEIAMQKEAGQWRGVSKK